MDESSSRLPPDAFASPVPQQMNPYSRYPVQSHPHSHPHHGQRAQTTQGGSRPLDSPYAVQLGVASPALGPGDAFASPFESAIASGLYGDGYQLQQGQLQQGQLQQGQLQQGQLQQGQLQQGRLQQEIQQGQIQQGQIQQGVQQQPEPGRIRQHQAQLRQQLQDNQQQQQRQRQQHQQQQQQQHQHLYAAAAQPATPVLPPRQPSQQLDLATIHSGSPGGQDRAKSDAQQLGLLAPQTPLDGSPYLASAQVQVQGLAHGPGTTAIRGSEELVALQRQAGHFPGSGQALDLPKQSGHFPGLKQILDPPHLELWRQVLFEVDSPIELTEEEFQVYFPHVDNVYSHRSTQRYKRQPFVSHYWDCRLKGRPPGTPKSDDPSKRKRKRQARERDLCDVKIKITEFFPNARDVTGNHAPAAGPTGVLPGAEPMQLLGLVDATRQAPGADGARYYQVQRVNGNGGNGKADGVAGPHKHSLQESDRIKKNSIQRAFAKDQKDKKKAEKTNHKKATGMALTTVKRHLKEDALKFHASWSDPFAQRVWIALEVKGVPYQYVETELLGSQRLWSTGELARGSGPLLQYEDWSCRNSAVLVQYIDDLYSERLQLLPGDARTKAHSRLWGEYVTKELVPAYYRLLEAEEPVQQQQRSAAFQQDLQELIEAAHPTGPFFLGAQLSYVDIMVAPWIVRLRRVLKAYRGWQDPDEGSRWSQWVEAIEMAPAVVRTTSADGLYCEAVDKHLAQKALNSGTSEAYDEGRGLP